MTWTSEQRETLQFISSALGLFAIVSLFAAGIVNALWNADERVQTKRKNQRGFALILEMMICCCVLAILLSMAVAPILKLRATEQTTQAKQRLMQVLNASSAISLCAIPMNSCSAAGVAGLVPPAGTLTTQGFTYRMVAVDSVTWQLTATPVAFGFTGTTAMYVSNSDGVLRCSFSGPATAASGPC